MFQFFKFQHLNFSSVVVCLLVQKAWLNSELVELCTQWLVWYEMSVWKWFDWANVWIEWIVMIGWLFWSSLQSLEENEHVIGSMSENVSWFVKLIVKERISRNPVRVWSLIMRERLMLSNGFCMNLWIWNECVKLKMMKAMFWLKIAT